LSVGENIKKRREALNLSQRDLAAQVGIAQPFLCQVERGTKNPSLQVAAEISKVLECALQDLLQ
jgi:DNA-binding helix-turn-helix protein